MKWRWKEQTSRFYRWWTAERLHAAHDVPGAEGQTLKVCSHECFSGLHVRDVRRVKRLHGSVRTSFSGIQRTPCSSSRSRRSVQEIPGEDHRDPSTAIFFVSNLKRPSVGGVTIWAAQSQDGLKTSPNQKHCKGDRGVSVYFCCTKPKL